MADELMTITLSKAELIEIYSFLDEHQELLVQKGDLISLQKVQALLQKLCVEFHNTSLKEEIL